jgi:hypothetical protein
MTKVIGSWVGTEIAVTLNCAGVLEMTGKAIRIDDSGILLGHPDGPYFFPVTSILQVRGSVPIPEWSAQPEGKPV